MKPFQNYRKLPIHSLVLSDISFDGIKIETKLIYGNNTGALIGLVDLGDLEINFTELENRNWYHMLMDYALNLH